MISDVFPTVAELEVELITLAREAAQLAVELRGRGLAITYKADDSPTTNADLAVEAMIRDELRSRGYRFAYVGEETGAEASDGGYEILVDGIDGTRNFRDRNYGWCTSIAVRRGGEVVLAVIHDEYSQATFTASKGGGAAIVSSGARETCLTPVALPADFSFSVGSFRVAGSRAKKAAIIAGIKQLGGREREWGCVALSICAVARGGLGAFIQGNSKDHDHAAALLFAREAGAFVEVTSTVHAELSDILVANPSLAAGVRAVVRAP